MSFINKIDEFCAARGISQSQFEREAGISKGLISKWRSKGITPGYTTLRKIADYMQISVSDLIKEYIGGAGEEVLTSFSHYLMTDESEGDSLRFIPVYRSARAGTDAPDLRDLVTKLAIMQDSINTPDECFGYVITDSAMSPELEAGDIVVVLADDEPESGDLVIASVPGDETKCRKLIRKKGYFILQPFNRHYEPEVYREEEQDLVQLAFLGKVIAIVRAVQSSAFSISE